MSVQYCPTGEMLADFYTKPIQGGLFTKFRDILMGQSHISSLRQSIGFEKKERVENVRPDSGLFSHPKERAQRNSN